MITRNSKKYQLVKVNEDPESCEGCAFEEGHSCPTTDDVLLKCYEVGCEGTVWKEIK